MPVSIFPIHCGVKQGCILSPTFFAFLCKRPSFRYKKFECGNNSWEAKLFLLYYADDMLVLFASRLPLVNSTCSSMFCISGIKNP